MKRKQRTHDFQINVERDGARLTVDLYPEVIAVSEGERFLAIVVDGRRFDLGPVYVGRWGALQQNVLEPEVLRSGSTLVLEIYPGSRPYPKHGVSVFGQAVVKAPEALITEKSKTP